MNLLNTGYGVKAILLRGDRVLVLHKPSGKQDLQGAGLRQTTHLRGSLLSQIVKISNTSLRIWTKEKIMSFFSRSVILPKTFLI